LASNDGGCAGLDVVPLRGELEMSIWSSVRGEDITALNNDSHAAYYRGEAVETIYLDVATARSWHNRIRLAIWDEGDRKGVDETILLSPIAARALAAKLSEAANHVSPEVT